MERAKKLRSADAQITAQSDEGAHAEHGRTMNEIKHRHAAANIGAGPIAAHAERGADMRKAEDGAAAGHA